MNSFSLLLHLQTLVRWMIHQRSLLELFGKPLIAPPMTDLEWPVVGLVCLQVTSRLLSLAEAFNSMYTQKETHPILSCDDEDLKVQCMASCSVCYEWASAGGTTGPNWRGSKCNEGWVVCLEHSGTRINIIRVGFTINQYEVLSSILGK